jgi:hypothetical protein
LPMKTSWARAMELPKGLSVNSRNPIRYLDIVFLIFSFNPVLEF